MNSNSGFKDAVPVYVLIGPPLQPWSTGRAVMDLQELLYAHGFTMKIDGDFGAVTEAAVKAYQHQHHLKVDGVVGAKTWISLKTTIQPCTRILRLGHTGVDVYELQGLLQIHGYSVSRNGIFNPETKQAVVGFQQRYHFKEDGKVGPITWTALRGCSTPLPTPPKQRGWFLNGPRWW